MKKEEEKEEEKVYHLLFHDIQKSVPTQGVSWVPSFL